MKDETKELLREFEAKIEQELMEETPTDYSKEYTKFRQETLAPLNKYERACKTLGKVVRIRLKGSDEERLRKSIERARLDIKPSEAAGLSIFVLVMAMLFTVLISVAIWFLQGMEPGNFPFIIFFLLFFVSFFLFYYLNSLPQRLEQRWRLKASSQMVPCILYMVVYMRHTSNLERAVHFAAQHLQPPLSLDLKKIFWNVETGKYATIKDALDYYLETWREYNIEFVEAFHLIESSLYEPNEARRVGILEKSLEVILDGVYEKMLHYVHDIKSPITNIYMLGIVLPTLGLALLPLASTLLQGVINWFHVMILFNVLIPFIVFYMTNSVLTKRPGGFGEAELLERNPNYHYYKSQKPFAIATLIVLPLLLIGISPFIFNYFEIDPSFSELGMDFLGDQKFFDFRIDPDTNKIVGPFGPVALLLSLFIPLSIGLFFVIVYRLKTQELVSTRKKTKELEREFTSSIFQLGNRLADGVPAEMAFGRVAHSLRGTPTAGFFSLVDVNITQAGMGVDDAIFNKSRGAINYYPSELIRTSMKILVESVKKGSQVAARAMMAISNYVKNIHKVNERLKDLLADITSGMKSNMTFLAPLLSAIVVGLASMITMILGRLSMMITEPGLGEPGIMGMGPGAITEMFNVVKMIPPYWLQIIVGIYIIQVIFILTSTLVTIEEGEDRLGEKAQTSKMLLTGIGLYTVTAFIAIIALTALAVVAVSGII